MIVAIPTWYKDVSTPTLVEPALTFTIPNLGSVITIETWAPLSILKELVDAVPILTKVFPVETIGDGCI